MPTAPSGRWSTPGDLLDLGRYPILDRASPVWADLVATCRAQLKANGACELPDFVRPEAVTAMAAEAERLASLAYRSSVEGNAYLEPVDESLPADHVKRLTETTVLGAVAYDQFPADSLTRWLYEWDPLMEFLAAALGEPRLHRYADPMGALNLAVMQDGDYLRWHFDQTDFVTSIALQSSAAGGEFEYVPLLRTPADERFREVRAVLEGAREAVRQVPMVPGTLLLFQGRYSLHRVTTIRGSRLRHVALLGYDTKPGVTSSEHLQRMRYGRVPAQGHN